MILSCLGCSSSNLVVIFRHRWYWLSRVAWSGYHVMVCMRGRLIGPDSGSPRWHRIATGPWCLLKVRPCSPLQLGNTSSRCVVRLPSTPSSSTSQSLHARISSVSNPVHISMPSFLILFMFRIFLGNIYAWRNFLGSLRGGVGWGLGTMFARQGDSQKVSFTPLYEQLGVLWQYWNWF